jgi:hypothetical protein
MSDTSRREQVKEAAEAVVRKHHRNFADRGITGPESALHTGCNPRDPGFLDDLADAVEALYGGAPKPGRRATSA